MLTLLSIGFFLFNLVVFSHSNVEEQRIAISQKIKSICNKHVSLYEIDNHLIFQDITERLLSSEAIRKSCKEVCIKQQRRIYLFTYPSDGYMIKGYLSLLPDPEDKDLLCFLRGGCLHYGLRAPLDRFSLFPDCNVIATTYRGGVSEGVNEYGGDDINDIPHLISHIPVLEKILGHSISQKKRYILGRSRGGMQLVLALARYPHLQDYFTKGVILSGLLDIPEIIHLREEMKEMFTNYYGLKEDPQWIEKRNPMYYTADMRIPLLILIGHQDIFTPPASGIRFYKQLRCPATLIESQDGDHCLGNQPNIIPTIYNWLKPPYG